MVQHEPVGQATFVKRWPEGVSSPLRMTAYRVATYGRSNGGPFEKGDIVDADRLRGVLEKYRPGA